MASEVLLLLVQIDDAPGELLGDVVRTLGEMGAKNVQLLSSLAKKGRPGYVLLIDILAQQEAEAKKGGAAAPKGGAGWRTGRVGLPRLAV